MTQQRNLVSNSHRIMAGLFTCAAALDAMQKLIEDVVACPFSANTGTTVQLICVSMQSRFKRFREPGDEQLFSSEQESEIDRIYGIIRYIDELFSAHRQTVWSLEYSALYMCRWMEQEAFREGLRVTDAGSRKPDAKRRCVHKGTVQEIATAHAETLIRPVAVPLVLVGAMAAVSVIASFFRRKRPRDARD